MSDQYEFPEPPQKRKRSTEAGIPVAPPVSRPARWPWVIMGCMLTCCLGTCVLTCLIAAGAGTLFSKLDDHHLTSNGSETVSVADVEGDLAVDVRNPWGNVEIKT